MRYVIRLGLIGVITLFAVATAYAQGFPELPALTGNERLPLAYVNPPALLPLFTDPAQIAKYVATKNGVSIAFSPPSCDGYRGGDGAVTSASPTVFTSAAAHFKTSATSPAYVGEIITYRGGAATQYFGSAAVAAAGTGYTVGDHVLLSGGTGEAAFVIVQAISGGGATGPVTKVSGLPFSLGNYTAVPSNPVSTSGGTGTSLTLTVTWDNNNGVDTISSVDSDTQVHLTNGNASGKNVTSARFAYGTDFSSAINTAAGGWGASVPVGDCLVASTITFSSLQAIYGQGSAGYNKARSTLVWGGAVGGTVLSGDNGSLLNGAYVGPLNVDGMGAASKDVVLNGVQWSHIAIQAMAAKDVGIIMGESADLTYDTLNDTFNLQGIENQAGSESAVGIRLALADGVHDVNSNAFFTLETITQNGNGIDIVEGFANIFFQSQEYVTGSGNSIEFYASGTSATENARTNIFYYNIAQGPVQFDAGTYPPTSNRFDPLDLSAYATAVNNLGTGANYCVDQTMRNFCSGTGNLSISGTVLPTLMKAGQLDLLGITTLPTLGANGEGYAALSASAGLILGGMGSGSDIAFLNHNGTEEGFLSSNGSWVFNNLISGNYGTGAGVYPTSATKGWAIGTNFDNTATPSVDFWNTDPLSLNNQFLWYGKTGTSTAKLLGGLAGDGTTYSQSLIVAPDGSQVFLNSQTVASGSPGSVGGVNAQAFAVASNNVNRILLGASGGASMTVAGTALANEGDGTFDAQDFYINAHLLASHTAPTIASGGCTTGSAQSISANNGTMAFEITLGGATCGSTITLTMPAAAHNWVCDAHDITTPASNVLDMTGAASTTAVVLTNYVRTTGVAGNFTGADHLAVKCSPY